MTAALDHAAFDRWRADPIAFIEQVLCDPETGNAVAKLGRPLFLQGVTHRQPRRCINWFSRVSRRDFLLLMYPRCTQAVFWVHTLLLNL